MEEQQTLNSELEFHGVGLHTGADAVIRLHPAPVGTGITFRRIDTGGKIQDLPARAEHTSGLAYATTLGPAEGSISTVEHLLAALAGMGVDNALVEVRGPEIPILDGSALPFATEIHRTGLRSQGRPRHPLSPTDPLRVEHQEGWIQVHPGDGLRVDYSICFPQPVGDQRLALELTPETFLAEIAPARTFGFVQDLDRLRAAGLIRGGSLENAVVISPEGPLRPLRFPDEPVRHKILDLVGDLALLGSPLRAHLRAHRAGHALHARLTAALLRPSG